MCRRQGVGLQQPVEDRLLAGLGGRGEKGRQLGVCKGAHADGAVLGAGLAIDEPGRRQRQHQAFAGPFLQEPHPHQAEGGAPGQMVELAR